jgi:hypothetical protein
VQAAVKGVLEQLPKRLNKQESQQEEIRAESSKPPAGGGFLDPCPTPYHREFLNEDPRLFGLRFRTLRYHFVVP